MTVTEVVRQRIRLLIAANGWTLAQFAEKVERSEPWARSYLKRKHDFPLKHLEKVAAVFGLDVYGLLDERALSNLAGLTPEDLAVARVYHSIDPQRQLAVRGAMGMRERSSGTGARAQKGSARRVEQTRPAPPFPGTASRAATKAG